MFKVSENCSIAIKIAHTNVDVHMYMYAHSYTHIRVLQVVDRALGRKSEETEDY